MNKTPIIDENGQQEQITITPTKARELEFMGFILDLKAMHMDGTDTYDVYVK
jgi:hypothetical protein